MARRTIAQIAIAVGFILLLLLPYIAGAAYRSHTFSVETLSDLASVRESKRFQIAGEIIDGEVVFVVFRRHPLWTMSCGHAVAAYKTSGELIAFSDDLSQNKELLRIFPQLENRLETVSWDH